MSGNHVRQPCPATTSGNHVRQLRPATMSAKILRVHIAPPSNVQFVRSSMRFVMPSPACFVIHAVVHPAVCSAAHAAFAPSPICRLTYTVLFIVHAIRIPSCKPGFKHGRPPCPRCRRILLVSLCFTIVSHPFSASYGHMTSRTGLTSPAAPSAANIYTHLNDAHILHAKDKIESVFAPEMELARENKVAQKLHDSETIPYEQNKKASKSQ